MANSTMQCYAIPATPQALLLPTECVAAIIEKPTIDALNEARANWMRGYVTWENQRVPVMSFSALHDANLDESRKRKPFLIVLNPIPEAARKAYTGIMCFGEPQLVDVDASLSNTELPDKVDRRYIETAVSFAGQNYLIPRLAALGVAFSYF